MNAGDRQPPPRHPHTLLPAQPRKPPRGQSCADLFPPKRGVGPRLRSRAQSPPAQPQLLLSSPPAAILRPQTGLVRCTDVRFGMGCASQLAMLSSPSPDHPYVGAINIHELCGGIQGWERSSSTSIRGIAPHRTAGSCPAQEPALVAHPGGAELRDPQGGPGLPGSSRGSLPQRESSLEPDVPAAPLPCAWPPRLRVLSLDPSSAPLPSQSRRTPDIQDPSPGLDRGHRPRHAPAAALPSFTQLLGRFREQLSHPQQLPVLQAPQPRGRSAAWQSPGKEAGGQQAARRGGGYFRQGEIYPPAVRRRGGAPSACRDGVVGQLRAPVPTPGCGGGLCPVGAPGEMRWCPAPSLPLPCFPPGCGGRSGASHKQ